MQPTSDRLEALLFADDTFQPVNENSAGDRRLAVFKMNSRLAEDGCSCCYPSGVEAGLGEAVE